jgi:glutamate 5-kinase
MGAPQQALIKARRIVIKLGTQIVIEQDGPLAGMPAMERLTGLARQCAELVKSGRQVIVVSSGAVGLGRQALNKTGKLSLTEKQACAAVGQNRLMDIWRTLFGHYGLPTAQVLLTAMDFADRRHYLNLRQTLETLLTWGVVPIINENDSVSSMELQDEGYNARVYVKGFGDNDKLSALVASKLEADLLVILTNVDGLYTDNPATNPNARQIPLIESFQDLQSVQTQGQSRMGRGGMSSKLGAARIAAISGIQTLITSGLRERPLDALLKNEGYSGTLVLPQATISRKKRWIGASGYHGVIVVNEGARQALVEKQASLLPIGIVDLEGEFSPMQVVSIQDERKTEIGRGLTYFSSEEIHQIKGLPSEKIAEVLNGKAAKREEVVHRDNLVIFQEYGV